MEPFEDDALVSALESLRPEPRPAFAAKLDARAAAGFPRRSGESASRRLVDWLRAVEPRRALMPAGATALAAVAAVTVVVALGENADETPSGLLGSTVERTAAPPPAEPAESSPSGPGGSAQYEAETAAPSASSAAGQAKSAEGVAADSASSTAQVRPFSADTGPYASRAPQREIERSAQMVLGAEPNEVRKAASEVFETVHAYRGIVLNSSILDGEEGEAGASFELLIPSARLGDALAAFSGIAEVRSRHEASADITAPTVRTGELLRDSRAKIEGLLAQLASADTEAERAATEAELRAERRHAAYLRSQLSSLRRRANLSRVDLRIESGAASSSGTSGNWGVGDALGDAGHILAIAAAVTIVGLAILGPIALVALLAWLAHAAWVRRGRRRALA